jgi:hypothetical protein
MSGPACLLLSGPGRRRPHPSWSLSKAEQVTNILTDRTAVVKSGSGIYCGRVKRTDQIDLPLSDPLDGWVVFQHL